MIDACAKVGDAIRAQRWHQRMRTGERKIIARNKEGNTCIHTQHTRHMLANRHYSLMCLRWLCQKGTFSTNASWNRFSVRMPCKEMPTTLRALVCKLPFASWDLVMALWCTYPLLVRLLKILRVFEVLFGFDDFESFLAFARNSGVQPNAHSFSAVINACAKSGNLVAACEEFDRSWHKCWGAQGKSKLTPS